MRRRNSKQAVIYGAVTIAAVAYLSGCGNVPVVSAGGGSAQPRSDSQPQPARRLATPPSGSRAMATAAARRLLGALILPAGSRQLGQRPLPGALREPGESIGATALVDVYRLYRLPGSMAATAAFVQSHFPRGMTAAGNSYGSGPDVVSAQPRRMPTGIDALELVYTIASGPHGSSLLRADAQAVWYPPRSAVEYLVASWFRAVRISAAGVPGDQVTTRNPGAIARLVSHLNSLHAHPPLVLRCPALTASYQFALIPKGNQPAVTVTVTTSRCDADAVTVGGRPQPSLWDPGVGVLYRLAQQYLPRVRVVPLPPHVLPCTGRPVQPRQSMPIPCPVTMHQGGPADAGVTGPLCCGPPWRMTPAAGALG
jgi:hypothetical protein